MEVLVSICIPVYNGEAYLNACLESVFAQTLEDYEVVVMDDGSTDGSVQIIEKFEKAHPRLRFFRNEKNKGLVGNWNSCLEHATGKWIKFVFQDDVISPDCLNRMMQAASDTQALIVCMRHFEIEDNASDYLKKYFHEQVLTLEKIYDGHVPGFIPASEVSKLAARNICLNFIGEPSSMLFKKALISRMGVFDSDLSQICDLEYCLRIATEYGLKYVSEPLAVFRVHSASTTSVNTGGKKFSSLYSDPAVLSYKLLHDPLFKRFRHAISLFLKWKLGLYHRIKLYEAHLFLGSQAGSGTKQEDLVLNKYPDFEAGKRPGLVLKIIYRILCLRRKS